MITKTKLTKEEETNRLRVILQYRFDDKYALPPKPALIDSFKIVKSQEPFKELYTDLQALFINVDWRTQSLDQFRLLNISDDMMSSGLLFIWCEKNNIKEIIDHLDTQGFNYVENLTMVLLSQQKVDEYEPLVKTKKITDFFLSSATKKEQLESKIKAKSKLPDLDPSIVFSNQEYKFFRKAKRTLLIFRKQSKIQLELRHQRTGDIFFDLSDDAHTISPQGLNYIYNMIETLLPKAKYISNEPLKMMELFADPLTEGRVGWVQVIQ